MHKRDIFETFLVRKIIDSAIKYFPLVVIWLLLITLISILEQVVGGIAHGFPEGNGLILKSIVNSVLFALSSSAFIYPIFFIIYLIAEKVASALAISVLVIGAMISLLLVFYFNTALVPLGADLYSYS